MNCAAAVVIVLPAACEFYGITFYAFGAALPPESMEQVQLLKGASGFPYGFGAPGGIAQGQRRSGGHLLARPVHRHDIGWRAIGREQA